MNYMLTVNQTLRTHVRGKSSLELADRPGLSAFTTWYFLLTIMVKLLGSTADIF